MRYDLDPAHVRRALASYVNRLGDAAPANFASIVEAIAASKSPQVAISVAELGENADAAWVSYADAAARRNVSTRTISRKVATGDLVAVGRRISVASINALAATPNCDRPPRGGSGPRS